MNKVSSVPGAATSAPSATSPHIAVAPGLLDQTHVLVREAGESDERYQSRAELLGVLLDFAAKQG